MFDEDNSRGSFQPNFETRKAEETVTAAVASASSDEDLEDLSEGKNYTPDFSSRKEPVAATTSASSDEDDALSYFQKLAEE